jgi:hypothetical protein
MHVLVNVVLDVLDVLQQGAENSSVTTPILLDTGQT